MYISLIKVRDLNKLKYYDGIKNINLNTDLYVGFYLMTDIEIGEFLISDAIIV